MKLPSQNKSAYLAGPDVFFSDPKSIGEVKKAKLLEFGITGHFPSDNEITPGPGMAHAIFLQNVALLEKSAIVLANIVPFRGPSADPGTVWEIGYAYAKGIPVICYGSAGTYLERCRAAGLESPAQGKDHDGYAIEDFDERENLMITRCATLIVETFAEAVSAATRFLEL